MQTDSSECRDLPLLELDPAKDSQADLYSYLTRFDDKVLLTLKRQKTMLKGKYLTMMHHLAKLKKQLEAYETKVLKLSKEIDENDKIKKLLIQINVYKTYSQTLVANFEILEKKIAEEDEKITRNASLVAKKKKVIFQVNHENIVFSNDISRFKKLLAQNKSLIFPMIHDITTENSSLLSLQNPRKSAVFSEKSELLMNQLKLCARKTACLKKDLLNKAFNFNESRKLFEECLELFTRNVKKSQEIISADGLKGSLLFEIQKNKKNAKIVASNSSFLQDREAKNLVYRTLELLVEKKEKNPASYPLGALNIDWEEFRMLDGKQIVGLLCVSPEILEGIRRNFDVKQRNISELMVEIKK